MYSTAVRYLLIGNYGVGNFGDEALKSYFLRAFPEVQWQVISAHPEIGELPRFPFGLRSLLLTPWWRTVRALQRCDGVVFGGGTLFTDVESAEACALWWWHAFLAWVFRRKILLAFQGIGPFRTRVGEWCARWAVAHAAFVSVRDSASMERVRGWDLNTNIVQTFDPVFSLFQKQERENRSQNLLCIIPRRNVTESFHLRARVLAHECARGIHVLSLQPEDPREQVVCVTIGQEVNGVVVPIRTVDDLVREIGTSSFVLTQRYHGALAALALGIPFEAVAQGEGDKLADLQKPHSVEEWKTRIADGERELRLALKG